MRNQFLKAAFLMLLTCGMGFLVSCSDDDGPDKGGDGTVPQTILDAFQGQYGDTRATWTTKDGYAIAEFSGDKGKATAWYALDDARWGMTETEIPFASLPQAITAAIGESAYADWIPDNEVDVLERNGSEKLYVVEMEKQGVDVDLYFTEDGVLVNEYVDTDGKGNDYTGYLPQSPESGIHDWIGQHFPDARIVDIDKESNGTEVEIVQDGMKHEILFDAASNWVRTKTEYGHHNYPDVVRTFVQTRYPDYHIDDVDWYETTTDSYYCVEIERGDREKKIYLDEAGEEISRPSTGDVNIGGGDVTVDSGLEAVLNEKYPDAVVVERDYDDGRIEIEIRHDGREKEVFFNFKEEWLYTTYDIRPDELPEAVKASLTERFGANAYWDDDIECVETPEGTFYEVEVYDELDVYVSADGNIIRVED